MHFCDILDFNEISGNFERLYFGCEKSWSSRKDTKEKINFQIVDMTNDMEIQRAKQAAQW